MTSNAYQVGQTYLLNNPFKIIAEREAKEQASRDMEKQKRRALNKAQKKKNKKEVDIWSYTGATVEEAIQKA